MKKTILTQKAFEAARGFIETEARPLEMARFRQHFQGASPEPVLDALRKYRNANGGFEHALEPDLRCDESSALCTSIAFQILRSTDVHPDDSLVSAGMAYFLKTLDRARGHWRIIPRSSERSPHAPWWNQAGREDMFDSFSPNPTAEILGYLYDWQQHVPSEPIALVSDRVIGSLPDLGKMEMHELLCCLRLLETRNLPDGDRLRIHRKLTELVEATVSWDPARWEGYGLGPLGGVWSWPAGCGARSGLSISGGARNVRGRPSRLRNLHTE
ncbi:MAG: hypothetical protein V1800_04350 [Candidatus Latescibacterota bacterium]